MAYNLDFTGMNPNQDFSLLGSNAYNPMQSSVLNASPTSFGGATSPVTDGSLMSSFNSWLQGDTGRTLFGGTDPNTGFQSAGLVAPTLQGLGSLFSAWTGMQSLGLAQDQLQFQKDAYNTNLNNSIQSYNTQLEDRIRGRTSNYAGKEEDVQTYLANNRLGK